MTFGLASSAFGLLARHLQTLLNQEHFSKPSWQLSPAPCGLQNFWPHSTRLATRGAFAEHTNGSSLTARDGNRSRPTRRHAHPPRWARDEKGTKPCPTKRSTPATQRQTTNHVRNETTHRLHHLHRLSQRRSNNRTSRQGSLLHHRPGPRRPRQVLVKARLRARVPIARVADADLVAVATGTARAEVRAEQARRQVPTMTRPVRPISNVNPMSFPSARRRIVHAMLLRPKTHS